MQKQVFWRELWLLVDPHWSSLLLKDYTPFLKNCSLWEREVCEALYSVEGPNTGPAEKREEEGVAEMKCYEWTATLIPYPLALLTVGQTTWLEHCNLWL